jgi:hypothetical protein
MKKGKNITIHGGSKGQLIAGNGTPLRAQHWQPNSPCRCGSGKKTKRCCGTTGQYFNSKPNPAEDEALKKLGYKVDERVGSIGNVIEAGHN